MNRDRLKFVICGQEPAYGGLARELRLRGHDVLFLESLSSAEEARDRFTGCVRESDVAIVDSSVSEGVEIGRWITSTAGGIAVFYDFDTPVTLSRLAKGEMDCLSADLIPRYHLYLSYTGGPILQALERRFHSPRARALYCSADTQIHFPENRPLKWDLGYLDTYSMDRHLTLEKLLLDPARKLKDRHFAVAGEQYPEDLRWSRNIQRIENLPEGEHRAFYNSQRFTLNITRKDMVQAGFSPGIRLFEAAACGTPIISDYWAGLGTFFEPGHEILVAKTGQDVCAILENVAEEERIQMGRNARDRVLRQHSSSHRAAQLEALVLETIESRASGD